MRQYIYIYIYIEYKELGKDYWYFNSRERKLIDKILSDPNILEQLIMSLNKVTKLNVWYSKPNYRDLRKE